MEIVLVYHECQLLHADMGPQPHTMDANGNAMPDVEAGKVVSTRRWERERESCCPLGPPYIMMVPTDIFI